MFNTLSQFLTRRRLANGLPDPVGTPPTDDWMAVDPAGIMAPPPEDAAGTGAEALILTAGILLAVSFFRRAR